MSPLYEAIVFLVRLLLNINKQQIKVIRNKNAYFFILLVFGRNTMRVNIIKKETAAAILLASTVIPIKNVSVRIKNPIDLKFLRLIDFKDNSIPVDAPIIVVR